LNIVTMNSSRQFKIYNNGSATHVIVDLVGYPATSTTGRFVPSRRRESSTRATATAAVPTVAPPAR
jgi:hypothetical protein